MYNYTLSVSNKDIINISRRSFNLVDTRLIGHGARVSYIALQFFLTDGRYTPLQIRNLLILAALHDVGAYKTEEIDRMVQFETTDIWNHSIYGYLFFHYFSPFKELAPVILFHHATWEFLETLDTISPEIKKMAQIISLSDRIDIFFANSNNSMEGFMKYLERQRGKKYSPEVIDLFCQMDFVSPYDNPEGSPLGFSMPEDLNHEFDKMIEEVPFSPEEKDSILKMFTYSIDFRSPHTVTHTITTTVISEQIADLLLFQKDDKNNVICGATLHDLGKIGIPVEILEFPGKLSPQAMKVMKTHVALTAHILGDSVSPVVRDIALRHHEKLDGSGYPRGLAAKDLSSPQRVVAVADIVSALSGTRSYKDAFSKDKTISIITEMAKKGLLDQKIVNIVVDNYDSIIAAVAKKAAPILTIYQEMRDQYIELSNQFGHLIT